jgi:hypothetical protein
MKPLPEIRLIPTELPTELFRQQFEVAITNSI